MSSATVSTPNGKVKGKIVKLKEKNASPVNVFRNIPFGKPPLGSLRFMPPQPAEPWEGVRDGTEPGNVPTCSAMLDEMGMQFFPLPDQFKSEQVRSEDCLNLSVYTPSIEKGKRLPVMVWLYGGGFNFGSEREYDGSAIAGMNDVVVVIPNYRINIFGFLSLGQSSLVPGNAGIMDQQLALKWVQENIKCFGGDKNNVTIFGESAGSMSVEIHMISPLSRGLFHKAISQSGQLKMPGAIRTVEKNAASNKVFFDHLKITDTDNDKILEALQKIPAQDLISAIEGLMETNEQDVTFAPIFDGKVFPKPHEELLKERAFAKVPYMIGCNNSEGQGILSIFALPNYFDGISEEEMKQTLYFPISEEGYEKCKEFYLKDKSDEKRFSKMMGSMMGDAMFVSKAVESASLYSSSIPHTYLYYVTVKFRMFQDSEYGAGIKNKPEWCFCDHGDDIILTFGVPFLPYPMKPEAKFSKEEEKISRKLMSYLTNFAKSGDPNKGKTVDTKWPKYKPKGEYLVVDEKFSVKRNLAEKEVNFWNNVMPPYMGDDKKKSAEGTAF